jgi:hypothetical protein
MLLNMKLVSINIQQHHNLNTDKSYYKKIFL